MNTKIRLTIEIDETLRYTIKRRALEQRISLKDWILSAIATKIQEEDDLNAKKDE